MGPGIMGGEERGFKVAVGIGGDWGGMGGRIRDVMC